MKLLKTDRNDGYAKIKLENEDDLWHLKDFITKGDRLRTRTQRTSLEGREKKSVVVTIEAEKTEYRGDRLRVTGEIVKGAEDIELGYHTFNLDPGTEFELQKDMTPDEWERLQEMEDRRSYKVLFVLVEKGESDLYVVEESGIKDLSKVDANIPGKMYGDQKSDEEFYKELVSVIERSASDVDNVVLCGPGFHKERVAKMLDDETSGKTLVQDTSVTGRTGLHEAIKRGALKKVVQESRISDEAEAVEEFLDKLREDENVGYGEEVEELADVGAVKKLIITQEKHRENPDIAKTVQQQGGEVQKVHTDHESGERLDNFGGMAAILRYRP